MPYTLQQACIILLLILSANIANAATAFKFSQPIQSIRAGDSFELPTLTAIDANGNTDTSYRGTHTLFYWGPKNGTITGTPSYTTEVWFENGTNTTPLQTTLVCAESPTLFVKDTSDTSIVGSLTLNIMPASPNAFMLKTEYPGVNAGYPFTVTVTAIDIFGNIADAYEGNKSLSWTSTASPAPYGTASPSIPGNGFRMFSQGKTTIPGFALFNASETPVVKVSDGVIIGSLKIKVNPGQNDRFNITTQHNNIETAGIGFGIDLIIVDPYGNLTGTPSSTLPISCDWDATSSPDKSTPQRPEGTRSILFTAGKASFGTFILLNANEMPRITVRSDTLISGTSSPIAVNASSAERLRFFSPGTATAGDAFLLGTIIAYDGFGNTATTYSGSKSITYSGPSNGPRIGTPSYTKDVFFERGISTTPLLTTLACAETTTVTVQVDNIKGSSSLLRVMPGSANYFDLKTQGNGTETVGVPFSINITARDIFGNIASKYEGSHNINCWWDATSSVDNILPTKPDATSTVFNQGQATIGRFILTNAQQTPIISASEGSIRGTTSPITVRPAQDIHHLRIITNDQTAGVPFGIKIIASDQWGNATEYTGTERIDLTWNATMSTGGIPPALPLSGSYTFKAGSVTIDGFKITNAQDTPIIHARFGTITGTSSPIAVSSGQATSLKIIAPTEVTMDTSFNLTSIIAQDICGNTATTYAGNKALTYNPAGTGTSYTSPVYFGQGISKTMLQTTLTKAGTVQVQVTDGTIFGTSNPITVKPGSITNLEVTTSNQGIEQAGKPFSVILTLKDKSGNIVTDYNNSLYVVWSWTAGNSPNNGTPTKPNNGWQAFTNGIARISGFILTKAGEFPSITANIGSLSLTGSSAGIIVEPATATSFKITTQDEVRAGASLTLTNITALDMFGNVATGYEGTKSLSYSGPGNGPISGEPTYPPQMVNFASGVSAQRLEMRLVRAESKRIQITQGDISGYSNEIKVTPANPGRFVLSTSNQGTEIAGQTFTITIVVKDAFGNDVIGYNELHPLVWGWDATTSPKGISGVRPNNGNQAFNQGIATVTGFILTNATQTRIWVSDSIISGTATINLLPNKASYFDISLPSPVTVNQPFSIRSIKARDELGNIAINYSGTMSINFSGAGTDSYGNKPSYPSAIVFEQGIATSTPTMPMIIITLKKPETVRISLSEGNIYGTSNPIDVVALKASRSLWPHEVYARATQTINYSVTNIGDNKISQIRINIPTGFTYIEAGTPQVSTNQSWSVTGSSNALLLTPTDKDNYLPPNAILIVPISVRTGENEQPPTKWTSVVTGEQGAVVWTQEAVDGDSEVSITAYILTLDISTGAVLPGGAATVTAQVKYQPTGTSTSGEPVGFYMIDGQKSTPIGTASTDSSGQAYIIVTAGTATGSITVEARYKLFNIQRKSLQVISPVPELSAGKNKFVKEGVIYANPVTSFEVTPFGSFTREYRIDTHPWQRFSQPFTIDLPGEHTINYRYVDEGGRPGYEYTANIYISPIQTEKLINFPNPFNPMEGTIIQYYLTLPADVHIQIYNLFGELVWMREIPAGPKETQQIPWNGRNGDGEVVGNGSYICRVIIKYPSGDVVMSRKIGVVK